MKNTEREEKTGRQDSTEFVKITQHRKNNVCEWLDIVKQPVSSSRNKP